MKLIDKVTVVAEIERRLKGLEDCHADRIAGYAGEISGLKRLLSFLDTLEVKEEEEEDLELNSFDATVCKIGNTYLKEMNRDDIVKALEPYKNGDKVKVIIKT